MNRYKVFFNGSDKVNRFDTWWYVHADSPLQAVKRAESHTTAKVWLVVG